MTFPKWAPATAFNDTTGIPSETCQYVVLLQPEGNFNLVQDLRRHLKLSKKREEWFLNELKKHRARVEYVELYSKKDRKRFGPIIQHVGYGIVRNHFRKTYGSKKPTLVAGTWLLKKVWPEHNAYPDISPETFRDRLLENSTESQSHASL